MWTSQPVPPDRSALGQVRSPSEWRFVSRQDAGAGVTHVIVEPDAVEHVPPQLLPTGGGKRSGSKPPPALVTAEWLAACLAQRGHASEVPFTVVAGAPRGGCLPDQRSAQRIVFHHL